MAKQKIANRMRCVLLKRKGMSGFDFTRKILFVQLEWYK